MHAERLKVNARQTNLIQYGDEEIDLSAVEQLVEKSQTRAIADAISVLQSWLGQQHNQGRTLRQLLQQLETDMDSKASSCYIMLVHSLSGLSHIPVGLYIAVTNSISDILSPESTYAGSAPSYKLSHTLFP